MQKGFPRTCLLADCYLKKPKVFYNVEEYTKHVMRCMQQDDRRKAAAVAGSDLGGDKAVSPRRQSSRITSIPLRVRLDHEIPAVAKISTPRSRLPASPSSDAMEVVPPASATLPEGSIPAESSGTPSSGTSSAVTSSATPSVTTSSETPSDVTVSGSELTVRSSEASSEKPSLSETTSAVTSSSTDGSPDCADFRDSEEKGVAGGVYSVKNGGNDTSNSSVNCNALEEEDDEEHPVTTSDATISDTGDCDSFINNADKNGGVVSGDSGDEAEQSGRSMVSSNSLPSVKDTMAVSTSEKGDSAGSGDQGRGRGRLQWTPAIGTRGVDGDVDVVEYTAKGRPSRKLGSRLVNGESSTSAASVAVSSAGLSRSQASRASSSSLTGSSTSITTRGRIAAAGNGSSRASVGRARANSTSASMIANDIGSVNGGDGEGETRGKRAAVGERVIGASRGRASFGGASSGSMGLGTGGRSRRCSSGDVAAFKGAESAAVSRENLGNWRGSLGSWGVGGAFTCPVNELEEWDLPGCGKVSRVRDTKCDSCQRVLRVDWQVG